MELKSSVSDSTADSRGSSCLTDSQLNDKMTGRTRDVYSPILMDRSSSCKNARHQDLNSSWKSIIKSSLKYSSPASAPSSASKPVKTSLSHKLSHGLSLSASWAGQNLFNSHRPSSLTSPTNSFSNSSVFYDTLPLSFSGSIDVLKLSAEDVAAQLTLIDLPIFQSITREELLSISWNNPSRKHTVAPNIVAFTRRFNQLSFWVIEEVLMSNAYRRKPKDKASFMGVNKNLGHSISSSHSSPKTKWHTSFSSASLAMLTASSMESDAKLRADVIAYLIKVARKLFELNNLHSCYAIISALNSTPIYRLNKTWSFVNKKDRTGFDRMKSMFSDESNFEQLRAHLSKTETP